MKKKIILVCVLAAVLMFSKPCVSSLQIQMTESDDMNVLTDPEPTWSATWSGIAFESNDYEITVDGVLIEPENIDKKTVNKNVVITGTVIDNINSPTFNLAISLSNGLAFIMVASSLAILASVTQFPALFDVLVLFFLERIWLRLPGHYDLDGSFRIEMEKMDKATVTGIDNNKLICRGNIVDIY